MNYWIRVVWEWIVYFLYYNKQIDLEERRKLISPDYEHKGYYTCLFSNLDMNLHMNNSVYFTVLEFSRNRYGMECGINQYALKNNYGFVLAGVSFQYRREVALFQTIETRTRIMGVDPKWMHFEHTCYVKGRFVGRGYARLAMFNPKTKKTVDMHEALREIFFDDREHVEAILSKWDQNTTSNPRLSSFINHQDSIKETVEAQ